MAPAKKTTKKKKDNGPRSRKYGCVTYNSEPQDNPDCHKGRCSPPARMISQDGTTKVTQIRYRRRNLDVVSKNCACSLKPASKTKKSAGSKTKTAKTAKTAKAPVKAKAPAKVKAPAKPKTVKAPAKTPVKRAVSPMAAPSTKIRPWYMAKFPSDELGAEINPSLTFATVWKNMNKGQNYYSMMPGDSVVRERVFDGISDAYKIPYDTVYNVWLHGKELAVKRLKNTESVVPSAKKEPVKAPAKTPAKTMKDDNAVTIRMSAPLSVQKRALATQRAKVQKKQQAMQQTVDVYDPDSPRPPTPEFIPVLDENKKWVMRRQPKTDKMLPWTFAHVYEKQADDKVRYPQGSVHVVKYKDKFYVAEGNSIISLKKDTKDQAFEQAYRLAKERHLDIVAFFKVKGSNPPKFRMQKLQQ